MRPCNRGVHIPAGFAANRHNETAFGAQKTRTSFQDHEQRGLSNRVLNQWS